MITIPTVLVLGAGGSQEFGFPTGNKLTWEIIKDLSNSQNVTDCANLAYCTEREINSFKEALHLARKKSVDAFLEHRPDFIKVGKIAIARALIPCEKKDTLFPIGEVTWYDYLFNKMNAKKEEFAQNKLSIITFNYDRSLENYMFTALKNSYGISDEEAAKKVNAIPLIHLYGKLGSLPWQKEPEAKCVRGYHETATEQEVLGAAENIKIIHDQIGHKEDDDFKRAFKAVSEAKRIIFVGFGYDETNLQRLEMDFKKIGKEFYGSRYGIESEETKGIARRLFNNIEFGDQEDNVIKFMRKKDILTRPLENNVKKELLNKVNILMISRPSNNLNESMYLRIIESLNIEEAGVLEGYVRRAGGGDLTLPLTSQEGIELCRDKLAQFKILRKVQAYKFELTEFGHQLCGYINEYDQLWDSER